MSKRRRNKIRPAKIRGQWVGLPIAMVHVLRRLSLTARRVLDTLEIQHCSHGGRENGKLTCTYTDFELAGIDRSCIREALDELVAEGLIEITRLGRRAYADLRSPTLYRLTYLHTFEGGRWVEPTDDWKQKARGESATGARGESATGNDQKPGGKVPLEGGKSQGGKCHSFIDIGRQGGGGVADEACLPASSHSPPPEGTGSSTSSPHPPDEFPSITAPSSRSVH
jgi:hypothetical protein